jgi:Family of unknown function (DUF6221)
MDEEMIAFLTARLNEREAAAKAAASGDGAGYAGRASWHAMGNWVVDATGPDYAITSDTTTEIVTHIALNDPASTLRDVEAKRKRLALYLDAQKTLAAALMDAPAETPATAHSYVRERINVNSAGGRFSGLETAVRLDVMVYSTHPDYRQEWAPGR